MTSCCRCIIRWDAAFRWHIFRNTVDPGDRSRLAGAESSTPRKQAGARVPGHRRLRRSHPRKRDDREVIPGLFRILRGFLPRTRMTGWNSRVGPCSPTERREALAVLYRRVPESLRARLVEDALAEADAGVVDLSGLWVVRRRNGGVLGAILTQGLAGHAAAVWAPEVDAVWGRRAAALALIRAALDDLRARGFLLAQALLDESAPIEAADDLEAGGMPHVTDLVYLEADTQTPLPIRPDVPSIDWSPFEPATESEFRQVLQETYIDSLDMPELEGMRSLDDVLASHKAGGRFVSERWRMGRVRAVPRAGAVLLLSEIPDRDAWEVAYLGITPAGRGQGLGRAVLAHALELARPHVARIELAVDIRNLPAHNLYRSAGLRAFDRRAVHIAMLADSS
jgi:mycothiol synthase